MKVTQKRRKIKYIEYITSGMKAASRPRATFIRGGARSPRGASLPQRGRGKIVAKRRGTRYNSRIAPRKLSRNGAIRKSNTVRGATGTITSIGIPGLSRGSNVRPGPSASSAISARK